MGRVSHRGLQGRQGRRAAKCVRTNLSVMSVAMELLANTVEVCISPTVVSVLALGRGGTGSSWGPGALALMLGHGLVGKLVVNGLDRPLGPLDSALGALFAWDEGVSLLGRVPEEGLDLVPGRACVSAAVFHQHHYLEVLWGLWTYLDISRA